jgi:tripartite-type tricarboxylate transporter receptor subunit TctC
MSAPAGTPRPIIERINKEMRLAIASEDLQKRLVLEGTEPTPSTPEEYAANLEREGAKWAALIKKLGLKFD